ncbi:hypothetical protein Barb4_03579 [Bacteroidales bacterium Barb4]|nr:hypothetical protein Barb4_03579 [Bacteroidales bacterium Barb4]
MFYLLSVWEIQMDTSYLILMLSSLFPMPSYPLPLTGFQTLLGVLYRLAYPERIPDFSPTWSVAECGVMWNVGS